MNTTKEQNMITFNHLAQTGVTEDHVLAEAKRFQKHALERGFVFELQEAVDAVIDAELEAAQG
jgi:hypothetical protein